jgi:hypothetical protein
MYIATTMKPTMPPTSTIMTASRMEVRGLRAAGHLVPACAEGAAIVD